MAGGKCPACRGSGTRKVTCYLCVGNGKISYIDDRGRVKRHRCNACGGSGKVDAGCGYCGGSGNLLGRSG